MEHHEIIISKTEDGFAAAATSSPYFCFVAPTEQEVVQRASRAIAFYHKAHGGDFAAKISVPPKFEITRLIPSRRIASSELEVA